MPFIPLLIFVVSSAAQTPATSPATSPHRGGGRPFLSPMGEPFRPENRGESGLAMWFAQADGNHDGQLTLAEMTADAERFFALLDGNHDGEIDPDEITRYETVVAPEISGGPRFAIGGSGDFGPDSAGSEAGNSGSRLHRGGRARGHGGGGGFFRGGDNDDHQGAARFGLLDLPEPVTAADTNFNRGVSLEEFRQAAGQRFLALDLDHHGYLTLAGLQRIRPAPPPEPNRKVIPGEPPSDDTSGPSNY